MSQLSLPWVLGDVNTSTKPEIPIPKYSCFAEISNRFLWDNGNLPFVFCGVTYLSIGELEMKKSNRFKSGIEFATIRLAKEDKEKFLEWAKVSEKNVFKLLADLSEAGYKVSISPDFNNSCVICSVTGTDNSVANQGYCMTSRAEDILEAIMLACYKHFVMADGDSWLDIADEKTDNWG